MRPSPTSGVSPLLKTHLARLFDRYLSRQEVIEVWINRPGEIWLKTAKGTEVKKDDKLTLVALNDFCANLATVKKQIYDETSIPFLSTSIPGYDFRIQVIGSAVAAEGISISIRCGRADRYPLENYFENPEDAVRLIAAIQRGDNMLIAGPTGSGKTTLLNSMLTYINLKKRMLLVEDSQEIILDHPNVGRLLKSKTGTDIAKVSYEQIVDALMRSSPDRILFSEIDIRNTVPFLLLMNTGHRGCMATIHSNEGAEATIRRMVLNAQLGGMAGGSELVREYALMELDAVVFVHQQQNPDGTRIYRASVDYMKDH